MSSGHVCEVGQYAHSELEADGSYHVMRCCICCGVVWWLEKDCANTRDRCEVDLQREESEL